MEDNKYFFKIFRKGNSGIAVVQKDKDYHIVVGGSEEINPTSGPFMGGRSMMVGQNNAGTMTTSFNATSSAFDYYKKDKSVRIESLLNENFEHIEGEISQNAFDKLRAHTLPLKYAKAESVFRMNGSIIYGRYFGKDNVYKYFQFSE